MAFIEIIKQPSHGSVYWNDIDFVYTPIDGYIGNDAFMYKKIENGKSYIFTKFINPSNVAPQIINNAVQINSQTSVTFSLNELAIDSTNPFNTFYITSVGGVTNGIVQTDGYNINYSAPYYNCEEIITYTVTDKEYNTTGIIRLSVVNGIDPENYKGPFEQRLSKDYDLIQKVAQVSSRYDSAYDFLSTNEDYLNSLDPSRWIAMTNFVSANSANLDYLHDELDDFIGLYNNLTANSADWITDINPISVIKANNQNWSNTYTVVTAYSSNWENNITNFSVLCADITNNTDRFNTNSTNVFTNSGKWDTSEALSALKQDNIDLWNNTVTYVSYYKPIWDGIRTLTNTFSSFYYDNGILFNNAYNTLNPLYVDWIQTLSSFRTNLQTNSSAWIAVYNSKTIYDNLYTVVETYYNTWITDTTTSEFIKNLIGLSSVNWDAYNQTISGNYQKWNGALPLSAEIDDKIEDLKTLNETIKHSLSTWNAISIRSLLETMSSNWDSSFGVLSDHYVSDWNTLYEKTTAFNEKYQESKLHYNSIDVLKIDKFTNVRSELNTLLGINSGYWDTIYHSKSSYDTAYSRTSARIFIDDTEHSGAIKNILQLSSINWDSSSNILSNNYDKWNKIISLSSDIGSYIPNLTSFSQTVTNSLSNWNGLVLTSILTGNSSNWVSSYNVLSDTYPSEWTDFNNSISGFNTKFDKDKINYNNTTNLITNSASVWKNNPTDILNLSSGYWDIISNNKDKYDTLLSIVCASSGIWEVLNVGPLLTSTNIASGYWDWVNNYISLCNTVLDYNIVYTDIISQFISLCSSNFNNYTATVQQSSTIWNQNSSLQYFVSVSGTTFNNDYQLLFNRPESYDWDNFYLLVNGFSANFYDKKSTFNTTSSTVSANYKAWGDRTAYTTLTTYSADWESTIDTLSVLSASWFFNEKANYTNSYSTTNKVSSQLIDFNTKTNTYSSDWSNSINILAGISADALSGSDSRNLSTYNITILGNSLFKNNLSAYGGIIKFNTDVIRISSFTIYNEGTTNALTVTKGVGGYNAIANFKYNDNTILYIKPENNSVWINVSGRSTGKALNVVGDISATGYVDPLFRETQTAYTTNSGKYETTYSFITANSASIADFLTGGYSDNYNKTYNYYTDNLSSINQMVTPTYYNNYYNAVASASALDKFATDYIALCSDNFTKDLYFRNISSNYETLYNYVTTESASPYTYEFEIGNIITCNQGVKNQNVVYYVQDDITIMSWYMYSDIPTTTTFNILCSYYTNYTSNTSIVGNNPPHLDINSPIKAYGVNLSGDGGHWITNISKNSILKFVMTTNTAASSIIINLKAKKR